MKNKNLALFSALSLVLLLPSAHAQRSSRNRGYDPKLELAVPKTIVIGQEERSNPTASNQGAGNVQLGNFEAQVGNQAPVPAAPAQAPGGSGLSIVDTALKIWDIVIANRAVANVESKSANALPVMAQDNWTALTGGQPERSVEFSTTIDNFYGFTAVELHFRVKLNYGWNLHGNGLYIKSAQVVPTLVSVLYGYHLNVNVNVDSIENMGTEANPVAQIKLTVAYQYGTFVHETMASKSYVLRADGFMQNGNTGKIYFPGDAHLTQNVPGIHLN